MITKSKPRKWDDDNIKALKELKAKGLSNKQIAKELDRTEVSIQIKLKRLNKSNTTYNDKHRKDKYRTNSEFLRDLQPTNVLDLYAGENSFYKDYRNPLITNDKNKEFTNCDLLITRKGFPNNEKHSASSIVDLPAPFSPTISVVAFLSKGISVKLLPVDKKFFQRTYLKLIISLNLEPRYTNLS